jgi:hypothetical protein
MATEINRKRYIFIQFYVQGLSLQKAVVSVWTTLSLVSFIV